MCEFCEMNKYNMGKPLASNKKGTFEVPWIFLTNEDLKRIELQSNYDYEEPIRIAINYCPMCGRNLKERK